MTGTQRQNATTKIISHDQEHESDLFHAHEMAEQEETETVAVERSRNKLTAHLSKNSGVYLPIGVIITAGWFMAQHFYNNIVGEVSANKSIIADLKSENEKQEIRLTVLSERADAKSEEIREIKRVLDLVNVKLDDLRARGVNR